jgi:uroporphyrin-III C-methyltransferase / precorrin-2 dehydrogenase / sirohydrochlorin ferrochelatase
MPMRYFPVFLDLEQAKVVVVGGGEQAAQKIRLLMKTPARIDVIAPRLCPELASLAATGRIQWQGGPFTPERLDGASLAYAAAGSAANAAVASAARARGVPINVVDQPELCSFITPAIVDRAPVVVAIGTEGTAPVLARQIKAHLESWLPARLGRLALLAEGLRKTVGARLGDAAGRRRFWERFFAGRVRDLVLAGREAEAGREAAALLEAEASSAKPGRVSLVGAGPGGADLLTFRALQRLQEADVIVYDRLVDPGVLDCARRDARRIYAGKTPWGPCVAQAEINRVLVEEAQKGHHVVRLKCGDPMIFGRVGEEMEALETAGIPYDIVPGVTSATACAAEARIPLTHREEVRSVVFLTGHSTEGPAPYDWSALARPGTVFALYMAVKAAPRIQASLLAVGVPGDTPVTIVEKGCSAAARAVHASLATLSTTLKRERITNPAMLFVRYAARTRTRSNALTAAEREASRNLLAVD